MAPSARTWNYRSTHISVDLQSDSSLNTCDLASHVAKAIARHRRAPNVKAVVPCDERLPRFERPLSPAAARCGPTRVGFGRATSVTFSGVPSLRSGSACHPATSRQ